MGEYLEKLSPAGQVTYIIVGGLVIIVFILSITGSWGEIFRKRKN